MRRLSRSNHNWLLAFVVLALAVRMLVPAGWMPAFAEGRTTITLCTGAGMVEAWVDDDGRIHKDAPEHRPAKDQPCAYAGIGVAADTPVDVEPVAAVPPAEAAAASSIADAVAIGRGLAAPPPPAIGPPALI